MNADIWTIRADDPNNPTGDPVWIVLGGHHAVLTEDQARELGEALIEAADHQGHDGDNANSQCAHCRAAEEAAGEEFAREFGLVDADGNDTGKVLRLTTERPCEQCGAGHEVGPDGLCQPDCPCCDLEALNGTLTGCRFDSLAHAADMRRDAL